MSSTTDLFFFFYCYGNRRDLHSFPTRRSSDLERRLGGRGQPGGGWSGRVSRCAAGRSRSSRPDAARGAGAQVRRGSRLRGDRKSTRLNSSHVEISYAVFCLKKKKKN